MPPGQIALRQGPGRPRLLPSTAYPEERNGPIVPSPVMPSFLIHLLGGWSSYAILVRLGWLLQIGLIVHVFRTGRPYWWCLVLFMAPGIGGLAYILIEILPGLRISGPTASWKPRAWRIRDLREQLEESDTIKLRLGLADELAAAGRAAEACALAEEGLRGVFRDDPHTLAAVARFRLEAGKAPEALATLERVDTHRDRMLEDQVVLLRGRALVLTGRQAEAQEALRSLESRHSGEEARYFLAVSLQQSGQIAEARQIWSDIKKRYRRANRAWRRSEKPWFKLAVQRLIETEK